MLVSTTDILQDRKVIEYLGVVTGEAVAGANVFRDFFAGIRDIIGGRAGSYEKVLRKAKDIAIEDMCEEAKRLGANAVIGVDIDYQALGENSSMLMVAASGTAVRVG